MTTEPETTAESESVADASADEQPAKEEPKSREDAREESREEFKRKQQAQFEAEFAGEDGSRRAVAFVAEFSETLTRSFARIQAARGIIEESEKQIDAQRFAMGLMVMGMTPRLAAALENAPPLFVLGYNLGTLVTAAGKDFEQREQHKKK